LGRRSSFAAKAELRGEREVSRQPDVSTNVAAELLFFRSIADAARDIILVLADDGRICYANQAAVAAYGYDREELNLLRIQDLRALHTVQEIEAQLRQARSEGILFRTLHRKRSGALFPVEVGSRAVTVGADKILISVIRDISELRHLEESRHSQREVSHGIVEGLDIPFFAVDRQYHYIEFNQAHVRAMNTHYDAYIQMGESILNYYANDETRAIVQYNLDEALAGRAHAVEALVGDAQREQRYLRIEHNPIKDGQGSVIGVAVFCSDISEQKKAEQEARLCDLRYRELVEDTQVVIMALGPAGDIGYINEYGLKFFGFRPAEILGQPLTAALLPIQGGDGHRLRHMYEALWMTGLEGFRETHENRTAEGKRVWLDWTVRPGVNPQSGEAGWLCVGVDVTARQRLLEEERKGYQRRRCNELMQDLIAGRLSEQQQQQRAVQLRLDLTGPFICLLFGRQVQAQGSGGEPVSRYDTDDMVDSLKQLLSPIVWETTDGIGVLLPWTDRDEDNALQSASKLAVNAVKGVAKNGFGKFVAVGAACPMSPATGIAELYEQAVAALTYGPLQRPGASVYFWHELGWIRLLAKDIDSEQTLHYVSDTLGPLLSLFPGEKREHMLSTLRELLSGDLFDLIAQRLNVHPQTVRYRKKVIERMLALSLDAEASRTNLAVALKLHEVRQRRQGSQVN
jgi:PAS domain S-box-containing protein